MTKKEKLIIAAKLMRDLIDKCTFKECNGYWEIVWPSKVYDDATEFIEEILGEG